MTTNNWQIFVFVFILIANGVKSNDSTEKGTLAGDNLYKWIDTASMQEYEDFQINQMIQFIDHTQNPCDNFFKFACGNAENNSQIQYGGSSVSFFELDEELEKYMILRLNSDVDPSDTEAEIKTKNFFASCIDIKTIKEGKSTAITKLLADVAKWPLITENWSEDEFDWVDVLSKVAYLKRNIFFEFKKDMKNNFTLYLEELNQIPWFLYSPNEELLQKYPDDLENFNEFYNKLNYIFSNSQADWGNEKILTVSELDEQFPVFQWKRFFSSLFGSTFSDNFKISSIDLGFFKDLNKLLSETSGRTIANYIYVMLYRTFTFDEQFEYAHNKSCVEMQELMGNGLELTIQKKFNNEHSKSKVNDIIDRIMTTTLRKINNSWLEEATKSIIINELNKANYRISLIDNKTYEDVNLEYAELNIDRGKYFENKFELLHFQWKNFINTLTLDNEVANKKINGIFSNVFDIRLLLNYPSFHLQSSSFSNFASLGYSTSYEDLYSINLKKIAEDLGNLDSDQLFNRTECYVRQFEKNMPHLKEEKLKLDNIFHVNYGIQVAYDAYQSWLLDNPKMADNENRIAARLNMTTGQAFFITFAQNYCTLRRQILMKPSVPFPFLDGYPFTTVPLMNYEKFAEEFNCPIDSPMNPTKKCTIL